MRFQHLQFLQAWQLAARHTESKRQLVALFTNPATGDESHILGVPAGRHAAASRSSGADADLKRPRGRISGQHGT
jgi:hypothetical protein